jgi:hypothetical protein
MPLNDLLIRNAKPLDKAYKLSDQNGLFLLINPNGSKYWRLKYYFAGKEKLLALGVYPKVKLAEARVSVIKPVNYLLKTLIQWLLNGLQNRQR